MITGRAVTLIIFSLIGVFVGIMLLGIADIAFSVSTHPVSSLVAGALFAVILTIAYISGRNEALACLLILSFPFMHAIFFGTSLLTLYAYILLVPFRRDVLAYFSNRNNNFLLGFLIILLAMTYTVLTSRYPRATVSQFFFICSLGIC